VEGDQPKYHRMRQHKTGKQLSGRAAYRNLYKSKRWQQLRKEMLSKQKWCQCPHHKGKFVPGEVVDHIIPHKGDTKLFFDRNNLQVLSASCHNGPKQSSEKGGRGFNQGCDKWGNPLNKLEHWTR